jgi:hypothetical protein
MSDDLKPDLGHFWVKQKSIPTLMVRLESPFVQWTPKETYVGFEMLGHIGTLIIDDLTPREAEAISKNGMSAVLKAPPNEKFMSADGRESVIPFRVVGGRKLD